VPGERRAHPGNRRRHGDARGEPGNVRNGRRSLTAALVVPPGVTLTGEPNQAMPIVYSAAGAPDYAGVKFTGAARLADIDVRYTGGGSPSRDRGRSIV